MSGYYEVAFMPQVLFVILFSLLIVVYHIAVLRTNRTYKKWPLHRALCLYVGVLLAATAVIGPLANGAHHNFMLHMVGHLLLGMLAPLLLVLSAPITLLLRALQTKNARRLTMLLKSWPLRIVTNPAVTAFLNVGGLWLLYRTNLYMSMHENSYVYFFVHLHVLVAGYLFTASLIYIDPVFHRQSFLYRALVLIFALASHGIVAKSIYAHPPKGVTLEQAEQGSIVMYYGGDLIDAVIIFILCLQWFKATKPRVIEMGV